VKLRLTHNEAEVALAAFREARSAASLVMREQGETRDRYITLQQLVERLQLLLDGRKAKEW
jgi:hypothetical protein